VNKGVRSLAKEAGCSPAAVSKKLKMGKSPEQIIAEAQEWRSRQALLEAARAATSPVNVSVIDSPEKFADAQRRKEIALADLRELELKERLGQLVSAAEVETRWSELCTMIRDAMLAVPTKIAGRLAAISDERQLEAEMKKVIREDLARISTELHESAQAA
jgi:hypothetical protein